MTVSPISINMPSPASPPFHAASSPPVFGSAGRSFDLAGESSLSAGGRTRAASGAFPQVGKALSPFPLDEKSTIKVLLLENVSQIAVEMLKSEGYHVDEKKGSLAEDELIATLKAGGYQALGIRSKTKVTARVVAEVPTVSWTHLAGRFEVHHDLLTAAQRLLLLHRYGLVPMRRRDSR